MMSSNTPVGIDPKPPIEARSVSVEWQPFLYIQGMHLSAASTTVLAIAPGRARDSSNSLDIVVPPVGSFSLAAFPFAGSVYAGNQAFAAPLFINSTTVGAGGIDQGTLAASTAYGVYVIASSQGKKPVAGLISLTSNVEPLLPLGYDSFRLLGFVTTDSSSHFLNANLLNTSNAIVDYLQPPVSALAGGNATTFTAINLTTAGAPGNANTIAFLNVVFTPAAVGNTVQFRPTGSTATAGLTTITGITAGVAQTVTVPVVVGLSSTNAEVDYKVSSASDAVSVSLLGWSTTTS